MLPRKHAGVTTEFHRATEGFRVGNSSSRDQASSKRPRGKSRFRLARQAAGSVEPSTSSPELWRKLFLAAVVALFVARPLSPSESAGFGDGLPFVLLWLLLATGWAGACAFRPGLLGPFTAVDAAVVLGAAWYGLAGIVNIGWGQPRAVINSIWDWLGIVAGFLLLRQLLRNGREARAIMVAGLGLAVGLSLFGLYQYFYEFPNIRVRFLRDPEGMLAQAGVYLERGSREWTLFVSRLRSTEPLATFALTNSLAGFLVAWTVIGLGILSSWFMRSSLGRLRQEITPEGPAVSPQSPKGEGVPSAVAEVANRPGRSGGGWSNPSARELVFRLTAFLAQRWRVIAFLFMIGLWIWVLLLTKSRSAQLAMAFGLMILATRVFRRQGECQRLARGQEPVDTAEGDGGTVRLRQSRLGSHLLWFLLSIAVATVAVGLLVGLGFLVGWDWQVLAEAPKSFGYRIQYWLATVRLIADRPLFGCGPGNFQIVYTRYMLPEASEVIADPHNFALELLATGGIPCGCLFLWAIAKVLLSRYRTGLQTTDAASFDLREPQSFQRDQGSARRGKGSSAPGRMVGDWAGRFPLQSEVGAIFVAALAGVILGGILGLFTTAPPSMVGLVCASVGIAIAFWVCWPWVDWGEGETFLARVAAATMLVHLSASGGISFAGVAGTLWTCLAVGAMGLPLGSGSSDKGAVCPATGRAAGGQSAGPPVAEGAGRALEGPQVGGGDKGPGVFRIWQRLGELASAGRRMLVGVTGSEFRPIMGACVTFCLGALTVACYVTAYRPVMLARGHLLAAQRLSWEGRNDEAVLEHFRRAAEADPLAPEPALALAQAAWARLLAGADGEASRQFDVWSERFVRLSGRSAKAWEGIADLLWEGAQKRGRHEWLVKALEAYRQSVIVFPTNAVVRAKFARALAALGRLPEAQAEAAQALALDEQNPHRDRKLPPELREVVQKLLPR